MIGVKLVIGPSLALLAKVTLHRVILYVGCWHVSGDRVTIVRVNGARITVSCVTGCHVTGARVITRAPIT